MIISELYFSKNKLTLNSWNSMASILLEGLGKPVTNLIKSLEDFKKRIENSDLSTNEEFNEKFNEFFQSLGLNFSGGGSMRTVWDIDGEHVIKFAISEEGVRANKREASPQSQIELSGLLPKVYYSDHDGRWIIMDKVVTPDDLGLFGEYEILEKWYESLGFPVDKIPADKISLMLQYLTDDVGEDNFIEWYNKVSSSPKFKWSKEVSEEFLEVPFVYSAFKAGRDALQDLFTDLHSGNVGWTTDGKPVLLDWAGVELGAHNV